MATAIGVEVFRAVADPTRRALLDLLADRERSVADLAEPFDMSLPAISQHLKVLREAGLVARRREGRRRLYRLEPRPLRAVSEWVEHYERFWRGRLASLGRHLEGNP
jgi:DNA-binding transcriptional ArsR family regulator